MIPLFPTHYPEEMFYSIYGRFADSLGLIKGKSYDPSKTGTSKNESNNSLNESGVIDSDGTEMEEDN